MTPQATSVCAQCVRVGCDQEQRSGWSRRIGPEKLFRVEHLIEIAGDMIRLGQLLKLAGAASGGADAKALIASGQVTVNGEPELRRGRKLHPGDVVRVGTDDLHVVAA